MPDRILMLAAAAAALAATPAVAQPPGAPPPPPPLLEQPLPLRGDLAVHMVVTGVPAARPGQTSTAGLRGHRHPGATYVYVLEGAVVSRLGDGPDRRYQAGEAWAETPGEAHYIISASETQGARMLVMFVTPRDAARLTEPLPIPAK